MTLEATVKAPEVRPVLVGLLDFAGDPAYGWTGNGVLALSGTGDPDLDGNLFSPVEGATDVSEFVENMANGDGVTLTFSAPDTDADIIKQIVRDGRLWQTRKMKIWLFFQQADEIDLHPYFRQVFGGVMVKASTSRKPGEPGVIQIDGDTDYAAAAGAPARLLDHGRLYPSDTFSSFILDLANGKLASAGGGAVSRGVTGPGAVRSRDGSPRYSYER